MRYFFFSSFIGQPYSISHFSLVQFLRLQKYVHILHNLNHFGEDLFTTCQYLMQHTTHLATLGNSDIP